MSKKRGNDVKKDLFIFSLVFILLNVIYCYKHIDIGHNTSFEEIKNIYLAPFWRWVFIITIIIPWGTTLLLKLTFFKRESYKTWLIIKLFFIFLSIFLVSNIIFFIYNFPD